MTEQPLTRVNFNIPMNLYESLISTSEREDRPLTTIVVCALEAYISQSDWTSAGVSPERLNASPTLIRERGVSNNGTENWNSSVIRRVFPGLRGPFRSVFPWVFPRTRRIIKLIRRIDPKVWLCLM